MSLKHRVCTELLNHQSHWDLAQANQNTKEIIINKIQERKCTYTEKLVSPKQLILTPHIPYIYWLEINLNGEVYVGPSVTLLSKIIMLLSRYVNSTLFIRYHVFFLVKIALSFESKSLLHKWHQSEWHSPEHSKINKACHFKSFFAGYL